MPPKSVVCVICEKEVLKAQTLSLKEIDGRDGRACRCHEGVADEKVRIDGERGLERKLLQVTRRLRIMIMTSRLRFLHSIYGENEFILYMMLERSLPPDEVRDVKKEIAAQGGLLMSEAEVKRAASSMICSLRTAGVDVSVLLHPNGLDRVLDSVHLNLKQGLLNPPTDEEVQDLSH